MFADFYHYRSTFLYLMVFAFPINSQTLYVAFGFTDSKPTLMGAHHHLSVHLLALQRDVTDNILDGRLRCIYDRHF